MDNLRPERDELDQFRDRSSKPAVKAKPTATQQAPVAKSAGKNTTALLFGVVALLLVGIGVLTWEYMQQRSLVQQIREEQDEAAGFIGQSKLLLARLEGQVSETGAEMAQTGSATDQKIAFLDTEVRKLWGIANDRNKKAIQANEEALVKVAERISLLEQQNKAQQASVKELQTALTERLEKLAAESQSLSGKVNGMSNQLSEMASNSVVVLAEVESLTQDIQNLKPLTAKVKEMDKDLASVDSSRQQLVQRVVDMERRLNQHQFKPSNNNLRLEEPTKQ